MNAKFGLLNGPNLHRLGKREPEIYGHTTLAELETRLREEAKGYGVELLCFQSNEEGALVSRLGEWSDEGVAGVLCNAGAYTHTSVALRDAIAGCSFPVIEVHISNVHQREAFRHVSLIAPVCRGVIAGLGLRGYSLALRYLAEEHRVTSSSGH